MSARGELLVTLALSAFCALLAGLALLPRLVVRAAAIEFEQPQIRVAVGGAVARPGVYELPFRSVVADALEIAGGMTAGAESSLMELAAPLGPGDQVFVPERLSSDGEERISVNSAAVHELERLPGVGPVMAARIAEGRPYRRLEDLLRVKGIGERTLERLRDRVRL